MDRLFDVLPPLRVDEEPVNPRRPGEIDIRTIPCRTCGQDRTYGLPCRHCAAQAAKDDQS